MILSHAVIYFLLLLSLKDLYDPVGEEGGGHLLKIKVALSQDISSVFYPDFVILKYLCGKLSAIH